MNHIKHIAAPLGIMSLLIIVGYVAKAQVGVGTDNPSSKAILHMESSDKGLIIPKMTNGQMDAMTIGGNPETGTLIYNTDVNEIFAFKNGKWYSMTPFQRERSSNITKDTIIPATTSAGNPLKVTSLHATSGFGITPLGGIIMWSGIESTIPDGWALCDGTASNGYTTPDLGGRFVIGHHPGTINYHPGDLSAKGTTHGVTGGDSVVTLSASQMPTHNHGGSTGNEGGHVHTVKDHFLFSNVSSKSGDSKSYNIPDALKNRKRPLVGGTLNNTTCSAYNGGEGSNYSYRYSETTSTNGTESMIGGRYNDFGSITNYPYTATRKNGNHVHSITDQGGGQAHENRPPYYTLAFIMRVK